MAYVALYRKWRPATFDDVISQEPITATLKNQLISGKTAHSYLFTGSRGTGKTSCAKILAKAVNCLNPQNGNPCLECAICKGIDEGAVTDVMEIDAASNNGVDDIRELREHAHYIPAQAAYRVYIIDEVHMLSTSAFNALLKIMEEPPAHVKFILATTEVHKVPLTILSRCQRFDFARIRAEDMARRLLEIALAEGYTLMPDAADMLARLSDGAMRDALSLLDVCMAYADGGEIGADTVTRAAGVADRALLFALTDGIIEQNAAGALAAIDQIHAGSKDLSRLCEELITHFRNLMLLKVLPGDTALVRCLPDERGGLKEQAQRLTMPEILAALRMLEETAERLPRALSRRTEVEMCVVALCSPAVTQVTQIAQAEQAAPASEAQSLPKQIRQPKAQPAPETAPEPPDALPEPPVSAQAGKQKPQLTPVAQWVEIVGTLTKSAPNMTSLLEGSQAYEYGEILLIDSPSPLLGSMIRRDGNAKHLIEAVRAHLGREYKIRVRKPEEAPNAPAQKDPVDTLLSEAGRAGVDTQIK